MIQTLKKNRWLLALCGLLEAIISVIYLIRLDTGFHAYSTVVLVGRLTLAAGVCAVAAGLWGAAKGKSWLLALNGLALGAFGLIPVLWIGPLGFRLFAFLLVVMAMSIGLLALGAARSVRGHVTDQWFLGLAGAASLGFALVFIAFVFRWVKLEPGSPAQTLLWLGAYFGFSAICMLGLALRLNSLRTAIHRLAGNALPAG